MKAEMIFETKEKCKKVYEVDSAAREKINRQQDAAQAWKATHKTRGRIAIATKTIIALLLIFLIPKNAAEYAFNRFMAAHKLDEYAALEGLWHGASAILVSLILIGCIVLALSALFRKLNFECPAVKRMPEVSAEQKEMREKYDTFKVMTRLLADSENGAAIAVAVSRGFFTAYDSTYEQSNVIVDFDNRQVIFPRD